ncbi:MAG: ankyrin repeat domain-containing protein [Synergistaceae bacterium]|nr:ankyrin repeat domain-containing protein [Synergistaceae bacterium]
MKKIFKAGVCICLLLGSVLYPFSSALGEISVYEESAKGGVNEVKALIGTMKDINARDGEGMTVLMWAAWKNPNFDVMKAIVNMGADVSAKDNKGNSALDYAKKDLIYNKLKSDAYKLLWTKDTTLSKDSRFVELCGGGSAAEIKKAISDGANANAKDSYGMPPIFWAAWLNPSAEVISELIKAGANPNVTYSGGMTPLIIAALENKNPEVVVALLNGGADPKAQDGKGKKAVDYAEQTMPGSKAYTMLKEASN